MLIVGAGLAVLEYPEHHTEVGAKAPVYHLVRACIQAVFRIELKVGDESWL